VFEHKGSGQTLINMLDLDLIVGSGGILSHAPRRVQSMLMMVDAYEPLGITELSVDSIFMMPHLGVLSTVNEQAAMEVFVHDCMIYLGTCIAPIGQDKPGERCLDYTIALPTGEVKGTLMFGEIRLLPLGVSQEAMMHVKPARNVDVGAGRGETLERRVRGGVVGLMLDGRGRPLRLPPRHEDRVRLLTQWHQALNLYPPSHRSLPRGESDGRR
jgi:hypothetical protein